MTRNVGKIDRLVRLIIGIILGVLVFSGAVAGILRGILLFLTFSIPLSGLIGYCPFYTLFGVSTCPSKLK